MIFLSKKQIDERFKPLDEDFQSPDSNYINSGYEGRVYKVNERRVAKIFNYPLRLNAENRNDLLKFSDIHIKNFIFLDELIYYPFKIGGGLMPLAPGKRLDEWYMDNFPVDDLFVPLDEIIKAIKELSDYDIRAGYDVSASNTLFDGKSFYFIDTSSYDRNVPYLGDNNQYNREMMLSMLYRKILFSERVYNYFRDMHGFKYLSESGLLMEDPKEVLGDLKDRLEKEFNEKIVTFGQASRLLSRGKK